MPTVSNARRLVRSVDRRRAALASVVALVVVVAGCDPPPRTTSPPAARIFPDVDGLPEQPELPDLFASFFDDRRVESAADFTSWRRAELADVLAHYAYGEAPAAAVDDIAIVATAAQIDGALVDYLELAVSLGDRTLHVAVFSPADAAFVPAVLAPTTCGSQSLVFDDRVRVSTAFGKDVCDGGARGAQAHRWPVARIAAAGFALVVFHESELAPDDLETSPGNTLAAWAAGSSLALDALHGARTVVDPARVAVFGHSRRGKAALLAAARDERIAAVIAHQSGTLGSSILRNRLGESLILITGLFPHWFQPELSTFVGMEDRLPFDQHHLVALAAPRPVLLTDGDADDWADPQGSLAAARAADAAWELLGDDGLVEGDGGPRADATLVWRTRPGDHGVEEADWDVFLEFLTLHLR